jgi:CBS domain-containing protein
MTDKQKLRDVMTREPIVLDSSATVSDAARAMKARNVGDVLVSQNGMLCGIVTDRDIVIRVLAEDARTPGSRVLAEFCSENLECLSPDDEIGDAVRLMVEKAIRRVPIVEDGLPVGILSLGDLAMKRDRDSALGQISAAPPQR